MKLGFCPIGNGDCIKPFDKVFNSKTNISYTSLEDVDAVVFWGGTDISPSFYDEKPHASSQARGATLSARDSFEWKLMAQCKEAGVPMIGVCRGAQMLCAFAGGRLIQHCDGHVGNGSHDISYFNDAGNIAKVEATSCHHQMMYPFDVEHEILAWATDKASTFYLNDKGHVNMVGKPEPEVVYFPTINGLAIQGHPEWAVGTPFADYCNALVVKYLLQTEEI